MSELDHYKKIFGTGDIATRGYITMVKILEQQINYLKDFKIQDEIKKTTKEDATYGRAKDMWEGMSKMILGLNELKNTLGIEYVEKEEELQPISAKAIANGHV